MKSFNYDNVMKAQRDGVWIVAPETAVHLTEAWERSRIVYLFFSVVASHGFQGVVSSFLLLYSVARRHCSSCSSCSFPMVSPVFFHSLSSPQRQIQTSKAFHLALFYPLYLLTSIQAHMTTAPGTLDCPPWAAKLRFSQGARPIAFGVKWLATGSVSFDSLQGLRNGTSGCRLAGTALDGTALDVATGYRLARMLQKADKIVKSVVW